MKCVCPECGHVAGMTAFAGEAEARDCMAIALRMPRGLADNLMRYLSLFRPPKRALSWSQRAISPSTFLTMRYRSFSGGAGSRAGVMNLVPISRSVSVFLFTASLADE